MPRPTLLAHVPAVTRGYLDFLTEAQEQVGHEYIIDDTITGEIDGIRKDLRRLNSAEVVQLIRPRLTVPVMELGHLGLISLVENPETSFYLPDDEVTEHLISRYKIDEARIVLKPVFLRWDRKNIATKAEVDTDKIIDVSDLDPSVVLRLKKEVEASNEWWRQVGSVFFDDANRILLSTHNTYVPRDDAAEIDGDIRSQSSEGVSIDLANIQHSEAHAVAEAARKGVVLDGSNCIVSTFPCPPCAKLLVTSGIKKLFYVEGYSMADGLSVLKQAGIEIIKVDNLGLNEPTKSRPVAYPEKITTEKS